MRTQLELGATIDTLTRGELSEELAKQTQETYRQLARGVKYLRFGPHQATISGAAVTIDGSGSKQLGPREGFVWSLRRITVTGLATGATPDVVNIYRNSPQGIPVWQFNGNNFIYTFGKTEFLLLGGETLCLANQGALTATGTVSISGDYIEAAAEEIYKLV